MMIAAMAAAVRANSTLRLISGRADGSDDPTLAESAGLLGAGAGEGAAENEPPKATGFTVGAVATATGGLLTGESERPTE